MEMMSYQPQRGLPEHREAGAFWLSREGFEVSAEQMAVTAGAHHGVLVALAAVTRPGEHIVSDSLTYPGVRSLARMLGLRLDGLAREDRRSDREGSGGSGRVDSGGRGS